MPTERISAEGIIGVIGVNIPIRCGNNADGTDDLIVEAPHGIVFRTQMTPVDGKAGCFYLYIAADGGRGNTRNDMRGDVYGDLTQMGGGYGNTHNSMRGDVYGSLAQIGGNGGVKPQIDLLIPPHRNFWMWDHDASNWVAAR